MALQEGEQITGRSDLQIGFKALAYCFGLARFFEYAQSFVAHREYLLPLFEQGCRVFGEDILGLREQREVHTGFATSDLRKIFPHFVCREAEIWRYQPHERVCDLPQDGLRGAASMAGHAHAAIATESAESAPSVPIGK